jgi:hypothetical protein
VKTLGYSQVTGIDAAAKGLAQGSAGAVPAGAVAALVQAEAQAVRWRDDSVAPTAALGMVLAAGDSMWYDNRLDRLKLIGVVAGAVVNVSFYG